MDLALTLRSGLGLSFCALSGALVITAEGSASYLQSSMAARVLTARQDQARPSYVLTPERKALLNTIRFAEGTWKRALIWATGCSMEAPPSAALRSIQKR